MRNVRKPIGNHTKKHVKRNENDIMQLKHDAYRVMVCDELKNFLRLFYQFCFVLYYFCWKVIFSTFV